MQVTSPYNNINFTKNLIKTVTVRKTDGKNAVMNFVEYDIKNKKDAKQIAKLAKKWADARYINELSSSFNNLSAYYFKDKQDTFDKYHFFGLEDSFGKILSLAQTTNQKLPFDKKPEGYITLDFIQTKPKEMYSSDKRKYKGLGETLLSSIVEVAQNKNHPMIEIMSTNEGFWNKNTLFKKAEESMFEKRTLKAADYASYIDYVKNKTIQLDVTA